MSHAQHGSYVFWRPEAGRFIPAALLASEMLLYVQFWLIRVALSPAQELVQQFYILYGLLLAVSFVLLFSRSQALRLTMLFFGILLAGITGVPFRGVVGMDISLFSIVVLLGATCKSAATTLVPAIVYLVAFAVLHNATTVWTIDVKDNPGEVFASVLGIGAVITGLSIKLLLELSRSAACRDQLQDLRRSVEQLSTANLGYSTFAQFAEHHAALEERKRVTREIHDGVGYAMTNIMMLAVDGLDKCPPARAELIEILDAVRVQAKMGLEDTRSALQILRSSEAETSTGVPAIRQLVTMFSLATRIDVHLELLALSRVIEQSSTFFLLFRFVQEALTNSLRHGHAKRVDVRFQTDDRWLIVTVNDDGQGADIVQEGMGLQGMRERFEAVGGEIGYGGRTGRGFTVHVRVPIEEEAFSGETASD